MQPRSLARWAAVIAAIAGCGSPHRAGSVDPRAAAFVEIENQSFYDMTIYVVRGGSRIRLGTVSGTAFGMFEIPRVFVSPGLPIRFQADPIGAQRTPFTEEIPVWPGDTIVLRIPPR